MASHLSGEGCHDAPEGCKLLEAVGEISTNISLLMDRAYEGDITRNLALDLGYGFCVPLKSNRKVPWGMSASSTSDEMRSKDYFVGSNPIVVSVRAMTNLIFSFPPLFSSRSLLNRFGSINTT